VNAPLFRVSFSLTYTKVIPTVSIQQDQYAVNQGVEIDLPKHLYAELLR
jgi:hypothetical protein